MMGIPLGNVVPGAKLLDKAARGINETFIGMVDVPAGRVRAYIKVMTGRQLVNELVATCVGRRLNLPIPEGYLVRARPEDLPESILLAHHGSEALLYASREIDSPDLKRRLTTEGADVVKTLLDAWDGWCKAMTFDEWVANGDRHPGNILFGAGNDIWLIDHSHCFTGPAWTVADLNQSGTWRNQSAENRVPTLTLPERIDARKMVASHIPEFGSIDCANAVSGSGASNFMTESDATTLVAFLSGRVPYLFDILSNRLGIPNL